MQTPSESSPRNGFAAAHAWWVSRPRWLRSGCRGLARRIAEGWERRSPGRRVLRSGEVMVRAGVLTSAQLERALGQQRRGGPPLGRKVVEMGLADETQVLKALNEHYRIHAASLEDNIPGLMASRAASRQSMTRLRRGLRVRLSLVLGAAIWLTALVLSLVLVGRQQEQLTENATRMGAMSLGFLVEQARVPLLHKQFDELGRVLRSAAGEADVLSAAIVDADGVVRAHLDAKAVGRPLAHDPTAGAAPVRADGLRSVTVSDGPHGPALHLARPVTANDRVLGQAYLSLSLTHVQSQIRRETLVIAAVSALLLVFGLLVAVQQGGRLLRPFSALLESVREGGGDQVFRVRVRQRHEFEDLAGAFDSISRSLTQKLLVERSMGRYVHPGVVEHLRSKPEEPWLKGIRQEASVLFTDVRGFTAVAEEIEPEVLVEALNAYFAIAAHHIVEQGGHVDKFIGDGVLGVFGVPNAYEDHALRAVKAAVETQRTLRRRSRHGGNPFLGSIGIGVNCGPLLAGNIGSEERMEYTVIGDCVNVASRLTSLAQPGEVIVSDDVASAIPRHLITLSTLDELILKGKKEPVRAHKVLRIEF